MRATSASPPAPALLEYAGLGDRGDAKIEALSGGMKRRLTLARALVNDPDILFLDEPTTALDPQARHLIWDALRRLAKQGKTLILTTIALDTPRRLIESLIEPVVLEVYGDGVAEWAERAARPLAERVEVSGETAFCYTHAPEALLGAIEQQQGLRVLRRAANLEDVFIKLTGRDIRD